MLASNWFLKWIYYRRVIYVFLKLDTFFANMNPSSEGGIKVPDSGLSNSSFYCISLMMMPNHVYFNAYYNDKHNWNQ